MSQIVSKRRFSFWSTTLNARGPTSWIRVKDLLSKNPELAVGGLAACTAHSLKKATPLHAAILVSIHIYMYQSALALLRLQADKQQLAGLCRLGGGWAACVCVAIM